jgi:hypothetical protein
MKTLGDKFAELLQQAELGDCDAQLKLAECYANRMNGSSEDEVQAMRWFSAASEQGCAKSQLCLLKGYAEGKGVEVRLQSAVYWYVFSCTYSTG